MSAPPGNAFAPVKPRPRVKPRRVWTAPVLIGAATLAALVGALLEDGFWDQVAASAIFVALAYAVVLGLQPADRRR